MRSKMNELENKLPKECCSFCTHLSLDGPDENYRYDIKCIILNCTPNAQQNCLYFEPEYTVLNNHDLDDMYVDFLEICLRVSYEDYLKSLHWQLFKEFALKEYKNKCSICGSNEDVDVYHLNRNLGKETIDDVTVVCKECIRKY
ncbi:hypothetical protein [Romboutsia sp.]|uniref:hypothetical protein n=1 Tax=Romboutsia sp. TaxID=1965302 RepID=UPI003F3D23B6